MDKCLRSEDIYEQFADAATALVMDQYASAMQESMAVSADDTIEITEELDGRCRKLIKKGLAKKQRKYVAKKLLRFTGMAAMIVLMLYGVVGILFTTVEAFRTPIINFFIEQNERYMEISGISLNKNQYSGSEFDGNDPLNGLLPEGYEITKCKTNSLGGLTVVYVNAAGEQVVFYDDPYAVTHHVDTEEAIAEQITIGSCEAVLVSENGHRLVWLDIIGERIYCLEADGLSREEIIELAKNIENN